jgi:hypothetical protein
MLSLGKTFRVIKEARFLCVSYLISISYTKGGFRCSKSPGFVDPYLARSPQTPHRFPLPSRFNFRLQKRSFVEPI